MSIWDEWRAGLPEEHAVLGVAKRLRMQRGAERIGWRPVVAFFACARGG